MKRQFKFVQINMKHLLYTVDCLYCNDTFSLNCIVKTHLLLQYSTYEGLPVYITDSVNL